MEKDYSGKENRYVKSGFCNDRTYCLKVLRGVLDKESSLEEEAYFMEHISECPSCHQLYQVESAIKNVVVKKIEKKPVPVYLADNIRNKLKKI
ncbi:anti-sigma factor [Cytophagaceae bacterium ABcell3]|nr:anti-sigma factor [Cytophagaceae bacterium ABcell3]